MPFMPFSPFIFNSSILGISQKLVTETLTKSFREGGIFQGSHFVAICPTKEKLNGGPSKWRRQIQS